MWGRLIQLIHTPTWLKLQVITGYRYEMGQQFENLFELLAGCVRLGF